MPEYGNEGIDREDKRKKSGDDNEFDDKLRKKLGSKVLIIWSFSNLPSLKLILIWAQSMKELQEIQDSILSLSDNYEKVDLTVLIEGKMFPTWIDMYLEDKVKEIKSKLK